jgi:hypothetical protein
VLLPRRSLELFSASLLAAQQPASQVLERFFLSRLNPPKQVRLAGSHHVDGAFFVADQHYDPL